MGYAKKNTTRNSGGNFRKKQSEYATQLKEKQKLKFIYGVLEKQFANYFEEAARPPGQPVEFFKGLPPKEGIRLKNLVAGFLYGGDGEE